MANRSVERHQLDHIEQAFIGRARQHQPPAARADAFEHARHITLRIGPGPYFVPLDPWMVICIVYLQASRYSSCTQFPAPPPVAVTVIRL